MNTFVEEVIVIRIFTPDIFFERNFVILFHVILGIFSELFK